MKRLKYILLRALRPGPVWIILLILLSAAALVFTFGLGRQDTIFGYISYALSAYALTVFVISAAKVPAKIKSFIYENKYSNRYMTDIPFRVKTSLYLSLSFNLIYAVFKLLTGILYASFWFGAEAVYYIILCAVRFLLLRHVRKEDDDLKREFQEYRFCGYLLFALNAALTGVVYQMINSGKGPQYPGFLIYAAATYAFLCLTLAIINVVKYRKFNSPVLSAVKAINLAKALVAMFSLQTAMFASFGGSEDFQHIMNSITGGCVCFFIFGMAVFMVKRSNRELKKYS